MYRDIVDVWQVSENSAGAQRNTVGLIRQARALGAREGCGTEPHLRTTPEQLCRKPSRTRSLNSLCTDFPVLFSARERDVRANQTASANRPEESRFRHNLRVVADTVQLTESLLRSLVEACSSRKGRIRPVTVRPDRELVGQPADAAEQDPATAPTSRFMLTPSSLARTTRARRVSGVSRHGSAAVRCLASGTMLGDSR